MVQSSQSIVMLRSRRDGSPSGDPCRSVIAHSLIPVVTYLGADLGALMGGAIVTERIFSVHGVGGTLYQAIVRGEAPTIVSFVTILVIIYLFANLLVDLLYAVLDPRIRYA